MELHILDETHAPAVRAIAGSGERGILIRVARLLILGLAFFAPVFFIPGLPDPLDLPKLGILVVGGWGAFLLWVAAILFEQRPRIRQSPALAGTLFLFLVVSGISTFASLDRWGSATGSEGAFVQSLLAGTAFVVSAVAAAGLFGGKDVHRPLAAASAGIAAASLLGLLQTFGVPVLPLPGGRAANTVGTPGGLANLAALGAVVAASCIASGAPGRRAIRVALAAAFCVDLLLLVVLDAGRSWTLFLVGLSAAAIVGLLRGAESLQAFLPVASGIVVAILLIVFPTPIRTTLPSEVALSFPASWSVAWRAASSRLLGSGPGTFGLDYAGHRPPPILRTPFWRERFDQSSSALATALAETGIPGAIVWAGLLAAAAAAALAAFKDSWVGSALVPALAAASAALVLVPETLPGRLLFFLLVGSLAAAAGGRGARVARGNLSLVFLAAAAVAVASFTGFGIKLSGALAAADAARASSRGDRAAQVASLEAAARRDRTEDAYPREIARETERSIRAGDAPADSARLQAFIDRGISAAKRAAELGPNEPENWGAQGGLYASLSPAVRGAPEFALAAYGRAESLEPTNPLWPLFRGRVLLVRSMTVRRLAQGGNEAVRTEAARRIAGDQEAAIAAFSRAIELKPDLDQAHFELAVAFEEAGRVDEAVAKLESVARYNPNDVGVAYELGLLLYRKGDITRAGVEFERALSLAPSFANARWFLASVRERQERVDEAISILEELLAANPENAEVARKLRDLRAGIRSESIPAPLGD